MRVSEIIAIATIVASQSKSISSVNQSSMVRYGIMLDKIAEDAAEKMVKATDKAPKRDAEIAADLLKSIKTEFRQERMRGRIFIHHKNKKEKYMLPHMTSRFRFQS